MAGEIRGIICIVLSLSLQITADPGIAFSRFRLCARFRPKRAEEYRNYNLSAQPHCAESHKNSSDICIFMECVYVRGVDALSAAPSSSSSSSHLFGIKIKTERLLLHRRRTSVARTLISLPKPSSRISAKIANESGIEIRTISPANEVSMFLKRDTRHMSFVIACKSHFVIEKDPFQSVHLLSSIEQTTNAINQCGNERIRTRFSGVDQGRECRIFGWNNNNDRRARNIFIKNCFFVLVWRWRHS